MSVTAVSNTGAVQLDSTVSSATVTAAYATSGNALVVCVAIASETASVASVTANANCTFAKKVAIRANAERDFAQGRFFKNPILNQYVETEIWAGVQTGAVASVTVTLTSGAKFAVEVQECTGNNATPGTAFPKNASAALASSSAPSVTVASPTGTSLIVGAFGTVSGLNQAAGTNNTLQGSITATTGSQVGIADSVVTSSAATTATVALAPVSAEAVDGISGSPGSPSAGSVSIAVPATYAVAALEVHV